MTQPIADITSQEINKAIELLENLFPNVGIFIALFRENEGTAISNVSQEETLAMLRGTLGERVPLDIKPSITH